MSKLDRKKRYQGILDGSIKPPKIEQEDPIPCESPHEPVNTAYIETLIQQNTELMKNLPSGPKPYQVLTDAEKAKALEEGHLKCYMCQKPMKLLRNDRKPEFYCAECHISAPVWGKDVRMSRQWEDDEVLGNHPPPNPGFRGRMGDLT